MRINSELEIALQPPTLSSPQLWPTVGDWKTRPDSLGLTNHGLGLELYASQSRCGSEAESNGARELRAGVLRHR